MSLRERKFKYRLDSLLGLLSAERDAAAFEARRARGEVEAKQRDLDLVSRTIESAQADLRCLYRNGADLSVARQIGLHEYLSVQRERSVGAQRQLADAEHSAERAAMAVEAKARDAAVLEKHRARVLRRIDADAARAALTAADEHWLGRKRPRGAL